ncbi:MAG TPA: hypothetical protein VLF62_05920 [Candidatus Saccharimonadales bacterium]|nr:hypothetical protein [Candidatus Saccharimonadales bacterium]
MSRRLLAGCAVLCGVAVWMAVAVVPAHAAINKQISFQGKLTNTDGTNVTDGTYSVRFRIYTDPTADSTNTCSANSCKWEETQASVSVSGGVFQVNLGSSTALPASVDFNTAALYLGVKVGSDAEMTPRIQLTAAPYAFNTDLLDGLDSGAFVQLSPGSQQTGSINVSGTVNSNTFNSSTLTFGAASTATVQAAASQALTLTGNAASTWSTTAGNITIQAGSGTVSLGSSTVLSSSGALSVGSGAATALTIDSGTTGALNLGTSANAKTITLGNNTGATVIASLVGTSTTAFKVQGPSSAVYLNIDSTNNRLYVGNPTADSTAFLLIFDYKNTTGDPTVAAANNGAEYYNSANNKFRCQQNSIWMDCANGFNTNTVTADQAATQSSTTMQNVTALGFPANANTAYVFDAWIPINDSNATADSKYTFTAPTGAVMDVMTQYSGTTATANVICNITASATACANTTVNIANHFIQVTGHVTVGGTAGTVQFQFAQNTSTAASFPVIKKGATISWHQSN